MRTILITALTAVFVVVAVAVVAAPRVEDYGHARICQFVRMYVNQVGRARAASDALHHGVTAEQVEFAKLCMLGK
jgi:hypothetical protein